MLLPRKKELFKLSLSELSFIVLNEEYDTLLRDAAKAEIERRFSKNGCGFDSFMERENEAISKRGKDISKYLITPKPSGQLLMETYFKYVNTCEKDNLHGNLLFSEVIICNEDGPSFVKKAFLEEIVKIKSEIDRINKDRLYGVDGFDDRNLAERLAKLEAIFRVLKRRVSKNEAHFVNTDIFRTVEDITDAPNSFCTPKYMKRLGDVCEKAATDDESKLNGLYGVADITIPESTDSTNNTSSTDNNSTNNNSTNSTNTDTTGTENNNQNTTRDNMPNNSENENE